MTGQWTNWGKNQFFRADRIVRPRSEDEAISVISGAIKDRWSVRVSGSGHSFTPIVETAGLLVDLSGLSGVIRADESTWQAEVWAGSTIASLGAPLWEKGLSLANQGDIDVQSIAGAVATGTKGSGKDFGSLSSAVISMRIINGEGEVVDIGASSREELFAAQVSIGLLGPVLRIGLQLVPSYGLKEENVVLPMSEVLRQWDYFLAEYRHFSFWWMPRNVSAQMYKLGDVPADHCFVKLLREVPQEQLSDAVGKLNSRTDRAYRIYPDGTTEAEFHELEYMVADCDAREAVNVIRDLMHRQFPDEISPLQVRWQKADSAFLSGQNRRNSTSLSVSGEIGKNYLPFLMAVDKALQPYGARPHWGKLHFLDGQRAHDVYPDFERFNQIRREFDPANLFLNPHLASLFDET
ncbi:D-arabinono-1,4-lactone oxidase [Brucella intermedia]|uniref:D-arabinono-1,4-lactone oxidase n=1 Tax=Brucella intermedia TaxID=94625 RepID=UPI00224B1A00|nr:D-arabinono-1,4-lactone oxidase [Brucella intermedia]